MCVRYQVVLVKPNKTEVEVGTVDKMMYVPTLLFAAEYDGTWLTATRKLLRYGRGEIHIREIMDKPRIASSRVISNANGQLIHELLIANHPILRTICLIGETWVGYKCLYHEVQNFKESIVFQTRSLTLLAHPNNADKDLAYECMVYFDNYTNNHKAKGAV